MKKIVGLLLGIGLMASGIQARADGPVQYYYDGQWHSYYEQPITVQVNGETVQGDMPPILFNDSTLVPSRAVFEKMGAKVTWNEAASQVEISMGSTSIVLIQNNDSATVNGSTYKMRVPAKLINDRIMIPVRFVSEALGMDVQWKENERIVSIENKNTIVSNIQTQKDGTNLRVVINADFPITDWSTFEMNDTPRLVMDLKNTILNYKGGDLVLDNAYIGKVRAAQFSTNPNVTRIVMDVKEWTKYNVEVSADKKQLIINFDCRPSEIMGVRFSTSEGKDSIDIDMNYPRNAAVYSVGDGQRVYVQVPLAVLKGVPQSISASGSFIKSIEASQPDANTAMLAITTSGTCLVESQKTQTGTKLVFSSPASKGLYYNTDGKPVLTLKNEKTGFNYFNYSYRNEGGTFVLSVPKSTLDVGPAKLFINDGIINSVSMVPGAGVTDLYFETKQPVTFNVDSISLRDSILVKANTSSALPVSGSVTQSLKEKVIVIDPGHGGEDSGAVFKSATGEVQVKEKDLNLDISLKLYDLLNKAGFKVYLTRSDDRTVDLYERATFAEKMNASLFVSVHNNSGSAGQKGTMTLFYPSVYDKSYGITGERFAQIAQEELLKTLGTNNPGLWKRPRLVVLNSTKMPAILAEVAYITDASDRQMLQNNTFRSNAANALYNSIIKALNEMAAADKNPTSPINNGGAQEPVKAEDLKPRNANGFVLPAKFAALCDYTWGDAVKPSWFDLNIFLDYSKETNKKCTLADQRKEAEQVLLSKLDPETVKKVMEIAAWQKDFSTHIWEEEIECSGYTIWVRSLKNTGICTIDVIKKY
mgnify:CR=1 FL=1